MKIRDEILNFIKTKPSENKVANGVKIEDKTQNTSNLSETEKILKRNNIDISKNDIKEVEKFFNQSEGTIEQKVEVIKLADSKDIDMTFENLNSINEALNGEVELGEMIEILEEGSSTAKVEKSEIIELVKELKIPEELKQEILSAIKNNRNPLKAIIEVLETNLGKDKIAAVLSSMKGDGDIKDFLKSLERVFQLDSIELVESEERLIDYNLTDDNVSDEVALENEIKKSENSQDLDEISGKIIELIESAINDIEETTENLINDNNYSEMMNLLNTSESFKIYIVKETTEKTISIQNEFEGYKNYILEKLEPTVLSEDQMPEKENLKFILNGTIDKLDELIMKSDVTLFTDMKTEKKLLSFSSELGEARKYVENGDSKKAFEIIKKVVENLRELKFEPSKTKIQAFAMKQAEKFSNPAITIDKDYLNIQSDNSSRRVLEVFRQLGLNHEYEVTEKIGHLNNLKKEFKLDANVKEILIKLSKESNGEGKVVETIGKTLNNLNGQQLLNKQSGKGISETLFFNIPIVSENEFKNMKLYVNSRDANNKLDWENCDLYFVINLKKYGDTGIKIDIKDRNVNISIKNDNKNLESAINPLLDVLQSAFKEVGLNVKNVFFRPMDGKKSFEENTKENLSYDKIDEKGFDFKI